MYKLVRPSPERTVVQHNGSRNPNESKPKTSVTLTLWDDVAASERGISGKAYKIGTP